MTIYPACPPSFSCAICHEFQDYGQTPGVFNSRRHRADEYDIPPICRRCETSWGKCEGGWGDKNRDRRIIRQISALAAILDVEAHRAQNGKGPLYAKG